MSTITVTLSDEQLLRIGELARQAGTSPEEWLQANIETMLVGSRDDFAETAAYVLEKNGELYRRLA